MHGDFAVRPVLLPVLMLEASLATGPPGVACKVERHAAFLRAFTACTGARTFVSILSLWPVATQDDEARFRPGTNKWVAFKVLREAGSEGLSVPQIMARSKQAGLKQWDDNAKRIIQFVRPCRPWPCNVQSVHRSDLQAQDAFATTRKWWGLWLF